MWLIEIGIGGEVSPISILVKNLYNCIGDMRVKRCGTDIVGNTNFDIKNYHVN